MKLRQARKLMHSKRKYGIIPSTPGVWDYCPAFMYARAPTRVKAFRRLAQVGEGPWAVNPLLWALELS